ncbi:MAG: ankyrin repeat domain-containing protein [Phycisphaerae bacterium]|nr:ankyrin repeat domain-containing protein [Phycisphaerae bacterium]
MPDPSHAELLGVITREELSSSLDADPALIEARDDGGETLLIAAANLGRLDLVEELLSRDANPNAMPPDGETALTGACYWGRTQIVESLLRAGADPNLRGLGGESPLRAGLPQRLPKTGNPAKDHKSYSLNRDLFDLLFRYGADGNAGLEPVLHLAVTRGGLPDDLRYLVEKGCDPSHRAADGATPLALTAECRFFPHWLEQARSLLRAGADPDGVGPFNRSFVEALYPDEQVMLQCEIVGARRARVAKLRGA